MKIALLIDGDNAQASLIQEIIAEVSKYGKATIRRIYGDWTRSGMNSWKPILNENSINAMQNFAYTSGKNATDGAMIIDAMDILHSDAIDGFCIVSSDSDFTGLAKRIREQGLFVMGIGRSTTPVAFKNSCEIFTQTENLMAVEQEVEEAQEVVTQSKTNKKRVPSLKTEKSKAGHAKLKIDREDLIKIDKAFNLASNEEDGTHIAKVGIILRQIDPSFDSRTFGFKNLSQLFEHIKKYQVIKNDVNGLNHPLVKLK
ncbi:NYN domain-containing protein [Flavobacterium difficile]|uniref:NYN domain-containing protein n=1 Tax=Flavobacterium difficile TaxID=2709659 RepID=A0ABX0I2Y9_9FLAO|nr:NYN domain-containing protein [Flavobacterium difficile]NHM01563.1 NYN domain-containing protein [Flavobacterium difficile]